MPSRDYLFYELTNSLCAECLRKVEAKIIFQNDRVYMVKFCLEHGRQKVLIATDVDYYKKCRAYIKPSEMPLRFNTRTHFGCPYDCGLCEDHEQHSCLSIIELTDRCNLQCPTCYSSSGPSVGHHRTLGEIQKMIDTIVQNEGHPDVVQISGGEPTIHPQFFEALDYAKASPIQHLMVNTNGIKIAGSLEFTRRLAGYAPNFEIYLQFDSFDPEVLRKMRGENLLETRMKALHHLNQAGLSTTLVVTLQKGLNDGEIGKIIDFALKQPCVRGVTFQPTQAAGRLEVFDPDSGRITLTEVRRAIFEQSDLFSPEDLIPVPCNPDNLAMAYALKLGGKTVPLSRYINADDLLNNSKDTISFERDPRLTQKLRELFSTANASTGAEERLKSLLCCLPKFMAPKLTYANVFRVIILQFLDKYNFDVRAVKKSCVHMVQPDGRIIPFDTMNLFYRGELSSRLEALRAEIGKPVMAGI